MSATTRDAALLPGGRTQVKASHAPPTASMAAPFHLADAGTPRLRRFRRIHRGRAVATRDAPRTTTPSPTSDMSTKRKVIKGS
jgi:hypothetical protein